ncbi:hypothetical protein KI387_030618, partial [Taxus chinensis]
TRSVAALGRLARCSTWCSSPPGGYRRWWAQTNGRLVTRPAEHVGGLPAHPPGSGSLNLPRYGWGWGW